MRDEADLVAYVWGGERETLSPTSGRVTLVAPSGGLS